MPASQGFRGLRVYQLAFNLAMEIFHQSKNFPAEESTHLRTKFVGLREAYLRTSEKDIGENNIPKCS